MLLLPQASAALNITAEALDTINWPTYYHLSSQYKAVGLLWILLVAHVDRCLQGWCDMRKTAKQEAPEPDSADSHSPLPLFPEKWRPDGWKEMEAEPHVHPDEVDLFRPMPMTEEGGALACNMSFLCYCCAHTFELFGHPIVLGVYLVAAFTAQDLTSCWYLLCAIVAVVRMPPPVWLWRLSMVFLSLVLAVQCICLLFVMQTPPDFFNPNLSFNDTLVPNVWTPEHQPSGMGSHTVGLEKHCKSLHCIPFSSSSLHPS